MTRTIEVRTPSGAYEIRVGRDLLKQVPAYLKELQVSRRVFVVGDTHTRMYVEQLEHFLINAGFEVYTTTIVAGEGSKNLNTVRHLYGECANAQLDRKSVVVAVGGGVVGVALRAVRPAGGGGAEGAGAVGADA